MDLEEALRRTFYEHEADAPHAAGLFARVRAGSRARRRRRLLTSAAAGLAAIGLVALTVAIGQTSTTRQPAMDALLTPPEVPSGMRPIGYRGVEMFVPLSFQSAYDCDGHAQDVYLVGDGGAATCGATFPRGGTYVIMSSQQGPVVVGSDRAYATEQVRLDGELAHRGTVPAEADRPATALLYVDKPHLLISVQSADPSVRERLMNSVHLITPDRSGCPIQVDNLEPPTTERFGTALIAGTPQSLTVCSYADLWIRGSRVLERADLARAIASINALPPGAARDPLNYDPAAPRCAGSSQQGFLLQMRYPGGSEATLAAHVDGCDDIYIGDRRSTSRLDFALIRFLAEVADYDGSLPGEENLQPS